METIKRFKNRKLYSTSKKQYVNLSYVVEKLKNKESFQVVEHSTNKDVTNRTLKQALNLVEVNSNDLTKMMSGE